MTDDDMDARLRAAGEGWRAGTAAPAPTEIVVPTIEAHSPTADVAPRRRHRAALIASSAAVAAALVIGGAFAFGGSGSKEHSAATDAADLTGHVWRLLGYNSDQQRATSTASLVVDRSGAFVADDACTVYSGHLAYESGALRSVKQDTPRERQCTDSAGAVTFQRFAQLLGDEPSFEIVGNQLTVAHASTTVHLQASTLPAPTTDVPALTGATWVLTGAEDATGAAVTPIPRATTFRLADGQLRASDGCNSMSGPAHLDGGTLRATQLPITAMACPDVQTTNVADLVISDGATLRQDGPTLTVRKAGAGKLTYAWQPDDVNATDARNLVGRTWHLETVAGEPAAGNATLEIRGRTVTVNDGCNGGSGEADVHAGWWTLNAGTTFVLCTGPIEAQAQTIDSVLKAPNALWAIRDGKLIVSGGGAQGFSLVYTSTDPSAHQPADDLVARWLVTGVETDNGNTGSGMGISPTPDGLRIRFAADGTVTVLERCGEEAAHAEVVGKQIHFTGLHRTQDHSCPALTADLRQQEQDMIDALHHVLAGTVDWKIDQGRLSLKKGVTTVTFQT